MGTLFKNVSCAIKSVDDNNPIPPIQKPRGYGGVAILWKDSLNHIVEKVDDGSERIVCIKLNVNPMPILLICAYMPCRGTKHANEELKDCLDQLHEIIVKYSGKYTPIICGDLNCDLINGSTTSARQSWLKEFTETSNLKFRSMPLTFIHPNGHESSSIDYILTHESINAQVYNTIRLDMLHNNTSDHYPLLTEIEMELKLKHQSDQPIKPQKVNWDKIDISKYEAELTTRLDRNPIDYTADPLAIEKLLDIIKQSQDSVVTIKKPTKQRNKHIWNDEIGLALMENKKALYQWRQEDKPVDGETMQKRKKTKKALRRAIGGRRLPNKEMNLCKPL
ncbi:Hypothetical predicted protein [Mytilus galloprovincialis]|uniref:Endonuclease/exonuclease/phosphatase domain-containing protein n=1 Tax=Mytilus galloprovincialis TaxID=29158 RepID=A0A8B6EYV8_MYTGA|nr:Hypothetical predicted protein [Mytilus galloprovincialis]